MKKVAKLLLVLGIAYWMLLIFASLTGCTTVFVKVVNNDKKFYILMS